MAESQLNAIVGTFARFGYGDHEAAIPSLHDPRGGTSMPSGLNVISSPPVAQIRMFPDGDIPKVKALRRSESKGFTPIQEAYLETVWPVALHPRNRRTHDKYASIRTS